MDGGAVELLPFVGMTRVIVACLFLPLGERIFGLLLRLGVGLVMGLALVDRLAPPGADLAHALIEELAVGLVLGLGLALFFAVGRSFGAVIDAMVPSWRMSSPQGGPMSALFGLAQVSLVFLLGAPALLLEAMGRAQQLEMGGVEAAALGEAMASYFLVILSAALPLLSAIAVVEFMMGVAMRLGEFEPPAQGGVRQLVVLFLVLAAAHSAIMVLVTWTLDGLQQL